MSPRSPGLFAFGLFVMLLFGCAKRDAEMHGGEVFEKHCAECHEAANPDLLKQPPKLRHLFVNKTLPSGALADDTQLRTTILQGKGTMPAFDRRLRDEDLADLLKYLHTL